MTPEKITALKNQSRANIMIDKALNTMRDIFHNRLDEIEKSGTETDTTKMRKLSVILTSLTKNYNDAENWIATLGILTRLYSDDSEFDQITKNFFLALHLLYLKLLDDETNSAIKLSVELAAKENEKPVSQKIIDYNTVRIYVNEKTDALQKNSINGMITTFEKNIVSEQQKTVKKPLFSPDKTPSKKTTALFNDQELGIFHICLFNFLNKYTQANQEYCTAIQPIMSTFEILWKTQQTLDAWVGFFIAIVEQRVNLYDAANQVTEFDNALRATHHLMLQEFKEKIQQTELNQEFNTLIDTMQDVYSGLLWGQDDTHDNEALQQARIRVAALGDEMVFSTAKKEATQIMVLRKRKAPSIVAKYDCAFYESISLETEHLIRLLKNSFTRNNLNLSTCCATFIPFEAQKRKSELRGNLIDNKIRSTL
jgi:hypothetical protein